MKKKKKKKKNKKKNNVLSVFINFFSDTRICSQFPFIHVTK